MITHAKKYLFIQFLILSGICHAQLSGDYTIGGDNPDFVKISDAVTALDTSGISASVTFNIRPGIYEENAGADRVLHIPQQITGVSATNKVTFQPDIASGGTVDNVILKRIVGSHDEKGWITEIRSDGVTLKELTFEYADTSTGNSVFGLIYFVSGGVTTGVNDITVTGCKLLRTSTTHRSPYGILFSNQASNITITNNLIDGSKTGISMAGSNSFRRNITVSDNTILGLRTNVTAVGNWQGYGISIENGRDNVDIRNNIIDYRNGAYGVTGIEVKTFSGSGSLIIEANQILYGQNDRWGQRRFDGIAYTSSYGQATIINNMISSRSPGAAIRINAPNCLVSFNTIVQSSGGVASLENAEVFYLYRNGHTVLNNIFIQLSSGDLDGGVMQINDTTGNVIDNNCLYKSQDDGFFINVNGTVLASFSDWQATGNGLHSIEKYPEFVHGLIDLHLDGCSIYDPELQAALPDANIPFDLDGELRDLTAPFFGADEASGTLPEIITPAAITSTADDALHFTSGDLDGDGDNDIAVVNSSTGSNDVSIFWNDGAANFSGPNHIAFGNLPEIIEAADMDGDHAVDLMATNEGNLGIRYGNNGGNFDALVNLPFSQYVDGFLPIDLDNDNDPDIFQIHSGTVGVQDGEVTQLINTGSRTFFNANLGSFYAGQYPSAAASGFINGDIFEDVVVVDFVNQTVSVLINLGIDGGGFWNGFSNGVDYAVGTGSSGLHANLAIGDIDGDGDADILVGEWGVSSDSLALLRNNGDGTFAPVEDFYIDDARYSETFSLFDYEGDNDLDLVVATQRQDLILLRNDGAGYFEQFLLCHNSNFGSEPLTLLTTQLDDDALPDIAVLTIADDIAVMLNANFTTGLVDDSPLSKIFPQTFTLEQNYPNPFNPTTVINYQIPATAPVLLTVFDMLGREVKVLVDKSQGPGKYSVSFDAPTLTSGVYVYKLKAGKFEQNRKMLLLR